MSHEIDPNTIATLPISKLAVLRIAAYEAVAARDAIEDVFSPQWASAHEEVLLARSYLDAELGRFNTFLDAELPIAFDADFEGATDPDATSIYVLEPEVTAHYVGQSPRAAARRRQIRATRQDIEGLREAFDEGWDVGPELAHEERRLAALVTADRAEPL